MLSARMYENHTNLRKETKIGIVNFEDKLCSPSYENKKHPQKSQKRGSKAKK